MHHPENRVILSKGKECQSVHRLETKCILITGADTPVGIELVREMCKRGAERVIMACSDVVIGQDVAVEIRGETNGDIIVEHCDMTWYVYLLKYRSNFIKVNIG